ncbi:TonB-dependent receptor [Fusobacterium sp.]|uniref:TonB-dependent receptor n=1 Tax=Fusobacterium sp. TaxID=68766 RepID=UPI00262787FF|nr:TonB-dependent receptor [Fusobacterium sp.]
MRTKIALLSLILSAVAHGADIELGKSVISATGFETAQKDTVKNVSVVTAQEIEEKNYQSVTDVLKDIPSVNVIGNPNNPIIDMRGQGKEKAISNIQVLVDGITKSNLDTNAGHTTSQINTIPIENIERIEVIPGGGAILYGNGTRGGIINIITKSGSGYTGGSLEGKMDSFGTKEGNISYGTTFGKFGANINYINRDYKGFRDGDESKSEYFEGSLKYDMSEKQSMTLKYSRYEDDFTKPRNLTKSNLSDRKNNGLVAPGDKLTRGETTKDEVNLKYKQQINDELALDFIGFYQQTEGFTKEQYSPMKGLLSKSNMDFKDQKMGIKPKLKWNYMPNSELIVGYDLINHKLDRKGELSLFSKEEYKSDFTKITNSLFVLNKNKINNFELSQGIRYENSHYDIKRNSQVKTSRESIKLKKDEENFAYEFVGNYLYSDTGNVYGKVERGFTTPSATQLYNKEGNKTTGYEYKENNLQTEKYITYEIGAKDYIFDSLVSGAIYLTDSKDEIKQRNLGNGTGFRFENIGKTRRYGAELSAEQYFDKLTLRESYSYVKTEILKDNNRSVEGNEISNVPNHKLALGLDYQLNEKIKLSAMTTYSAKYYLNDENKGGKQNSYMITDITVNYYPIPELKLFGGINNIFNEKYYNSINEKGTEFDPAAERNFVFGFKYNF